MKNKFLVIYFIICMVFSLSLTLHCTEAHTQSNQQEQSQSTEMPCHSNTPVDSSNDTDQCEDLCLCDYVSPSPDSKFHSTTFEFESSLFNTAHDVLFALHSIHQSPQLPPPKYS